MGLRELTDFSRHSEISIGYFEDDSICVNINGYIICHINYGNDSNHLIKTKADAVDLAKRIVMLLELRYGEVKEKNFPNDTMSPPKSQFVEGYECTTAPTEEEYEKYVESQREEFLMDLLKDLKSCCCD